MTDFDVVRALARAYPWDVDSGDELDRALGFLGSDRSAETVVRAGYGALLPAVAVLAVVGGLVAPQRPVVVVAAALAGSVGVTHVVHRAPVVLATLERTRALGSVTGLVGRVVLRMRIEPTVERSASFAARTGDDALAESLREHARRTEGTPETGLDGFAAEWEEWFPTLPRAVSLIESAADEPAEERDQTLDRTMATVLDGVGDEMADFAGNVRGPVTAVYAFGVLLPLALVGVLPAARAAGVRVSLFGFVAFYDVLLPLALCWATVWLFARRPVAFPPPRVERAHSDVPDGDWLPVLAGLAGGVAGWWVSSAVVAPWATPVAAVGLGLGCALVVRYRPVKAVRDHVRDVESGLDDALYLVGQRVAEGEAVETALDHAGEELTGATGDLLGETASLQRRLGVGVSEAFLGDYGSLAALPSPRTKGAAALLSLAATEGRPAGGAIVATADQLTKLRQVEADARRELASVTDTLGNTAAVFAPLVGGSTVALAERLVRTGGTTRLASASIAVPDLGLAIGVYVLLLTAILTVLTTGLTRGLDRALIGYRVGVALLLATPTFLAGFLAAGLFL
ncbi:MAG: type II secretion system protein [Haloferacaceae archaeon]